MALAYALDGKDGIACIDLDHCVGEDGKRSALADEVLSKCGKTYIKKLLTDDSLNFDVYDDRSVRLLIEYIRVMEDGKIVIMLKGGITIEERVE